MSMIEEPVQPEDHPSKRVKTGTEQDPTSFTSDDPVDMDSDILQTQIETIITQLNEDRENDQSVMDDMKTRYEELSTRQMELMNTKLQEAYHGSEDPVNERLGRLNEVLERIRQLEKENCRFKEMLGTLYRDVANPREC